MNSAEADATWCTDSEGHEFNCVNFACRCFLLQPMDFTLEMMDFMLKIMIYRLRDWLRLGQLIAQRGVSFYIKCRFFNRK